MTMRPCISCNRLIPRGTRCAECQRADWRRREQTRDPIAKQLYGSAAYHRVRAQVMAGATACAHCGATGVPLSCDHLFGVRERPDLALDPGNLVPCCRSCQELRKHRPTGRAGA
jgi:5-methylcytosine-specific restriction endonuclease McrA